MIERIEVWNFESHEHTVVDDLSPGINLFCGASNSGKSSLAGRVLKMVSYNDFDPKSVRVGASKCVVQVDTDKGRVRVTRGPKDNLWETTRKGGTTQYFDKVGTNIVPEAAEIIGLKMVTLGDVQIPVNIMDQLESHFMLAGVGDKAASGSMRAQIVDEISGLSGIEGLIKSVSLDHHRFGREITETEKAMEAVRVQLHPEDELKQEEDILARSEKELSDHDKMLSLAEDGDNLSASIGGVTGQIQTLQHRASEIPDTEKALQELSKAEECTRLEGTASELSRRGTEAATSIEDLSKRAEAIPDTTKALDHIVEADKMVQYIVDMSSMSKEGTDATSRIETITEALEGMPDEQKALLLITQSDKDVKKLANATDIQNRWAQAKFDAEVRKEAVGRIEAALESNTSLDAANKAANRRKDAEALFDTINRMSASTMSMESKLEDCNVSLQAAEKNRDAILATITICPLNLRPVAKECMEGVAI